MKYSERDKRDKDERRGKDDERDKSRSVPSHEQIFSSRLFATTL